MLRSLLLATALTLPALPAPAQDVAGPYLAGRSAQMQDDFRAATRYLSRALAHDPGDVPLLEALAGAYMSLLEFDRADEVAARLLDEGGESQVAGLAHVIKLADAEDWQGILAALDEGMSVGPLLDGLARAWALVGADRLEEARATFDEVGGDDAVRAFGVYHEALALASAERFEDAEAVLETADDLRLTRRGLLARTQILSQLGRTDDALELLGDAPDGALEPTLVTARERLRAGETLEFDVAPDAKAGLAEVGFDIANAVVGQTAASYALLYSRSAEFLRPGHVEATLLSAALFEEMGQYDLAIETYASIPDASPMKAMSELGRAQAMSSAGREEAAIETVSALADANPDNLDVQVTLGDSLRGAQRFEEALAAYDRAVGLFEADAPGQWPIYFARAITEERIGDWDAAEADFRTALELDPDQPQVLNYLGYSMLERREDLDEALAMIERAVEAAPDSGYIVDSLGWGLYRLGRYEEAVEPMERAVELMPVDPVVNDHLGDVLWAVGRRMEARFQWQRALSFAEEGEGETSEEADPDRIRRKLEVGLDQVLEEEGETPPEVADGG